MICLVMDYDEACFMHLTPGVVHNSKSSMVRKVAKLMRIHVLAIEN